MLSCIPSADLGGSSDYSVDEHRRLKRSRFPCEQYLDMGQSVLTPKEVLLGKVGEPAASGRLESLTRQRGKGNSGQDSETGLWGTSVRFGGQREALKQLTTAGRQGSLACGELSFLFDVAGALNIISGGEKRLNT